MGILQTLRDALALPALAAQPVAYESPWASPNHLLPVVVPDRIDGPVSRGVAMSVPALARARRLITGSIARCPLEAIDVTGLLKDQPRWLTRTDGPVSPFHRMLWTIDDLIFYGWSLWALERDSRGQVIAADRVPFDRWSFTGDGSIQFDGTEVDPDSVCLIPGIDEGILSTGAVAIRHAAKLNASAAKAAATPIAHTELHQVSGEPLSQDGIRALVESWIAARNSADGAVSFTNPSIEVKTHGSYDSALLVEGRQAAAVDIARVVGIPAIMLDAAPDTRGSLTYANVDARNVEFIDYCLGPLMAAIAARLGLDDMVPRGTAIRFNVDDLVGIIDNTVDVPDDDKEKP